MTAPSLLGLTPRSLSRSAFSIATMEPLSYGVMRIERASGIWIEASWFTGVNVS